MANEWYLAPLDAPRKPRYRIDCNQKLAVDWTVASGAAAKTPSPSNNYPAPGSGSAGAGTKAQPGDSQKSAKASEEQRKLKQDLDALKKLLDERLRAHDERLRALEEAQKALAEVQQKLGCQRSETELDGRPERYVAVAGTVLRFVEVDPGPERVALGLTSDEAKELHAAAQLETTEPIPPWVYRSVPRLEVTVPPFFLQNSLIDPRLYSRLLPAEDARRVSYQNANRFLTELNKLCAGQARFALPTEEQFVAAAQRVYEPVRNGLMPCAVVKDKPGKVGLTQLLGSFWQLTSSHCKPFGSDEIDCPADHFVRKGGAASSTNPLECMPEYRSPAPPDVAQKETSFRLVLVEG